IETATVIAANPVADSADLLATLSSQSPMQGSTISVATVTDGGVDVHASATYQWKVNHGSGFINAAGTGNATQTYTPTEGDEGGTLEVVVGFTDGGNPGNTETTTLVAANPVADSADLAATLNGLTGGNAVQGTAVSVATVTDAGTDVKASATYQW